MSAFGHTISATPVANGSFPIDKWLKATTANQVDDVYIGWYSNVELSSCRIQNLFDLGNDGLSIAGIGYNSTNKYVSTFFNDAGTITKNDYSESNRAVRVLQNVGEPSKLVILDEAGTLVEYDFSSVLEAGGNPTKTTLLTGIEGASMLNAAAETKNTDMKWIGDNNDQIMIMRRNLAVFTAVTLKNTGGTWALVDKEEVTGLTSVNIESALCASDVRDYSRDHWFNACQAGGDLFGVLIRLDVDLNITIVAYDHDTSPNVVYLGQSNGMVFCHVQTTYQVYYWDIIGTGDGGISLINIGVGDGQDLTNYWPAKPGDPVNVKAAVWSATADYLFFNVGAGQCRSSEAIINGIDTAHTPSRGGVLFTGTEDEPYKYLWCQQRSNAGQYGYMTLASL